LARFELARGPLRDRATMIIDVANMTGYQSPQHFTCAFHRFTGITPKDYRRHSFPHFAPHAAQSPKV
jgi:AraC-like DNA-binding protein